jgi:predicted DNA-binding protein (MmcQ/YjbR family)
MNRSEIEAYCAAKVGVLASYPFGLEPLVFKVGGKMFALSSEAEGQPMISLKCDPDRASLLRGSFPSITPGYHLNKNHWNSLILDDTIPEPLVLDLIDHSYDLVVRSLKKAIGRRF